VDGPGERAGERRRRHGEGCEREKRDGEKGNDDKGNGSGSTQVLLHARSL